MNRKNLPAKAFLHGTIWLGTLLTVGLVLAQPGQLRAAEGNLDQAIEQQAKEIISYLRSHKYQNVGVLKFLVQKGQQKPSDNVGPLNMLLADRLEVALILANPDESLGIIHRASEVAATSPRADHRTVEGRKALFEIGDFVYAWQKLDGGEEKKVRADVLLTGLAQIRPDQGETILQIDAYDGRHEDRIQSWTVKAPLDSRTLTEAGYSYRKRAATKPDEADEGPRATTPSKSQPARFAVAETKPERALPPSPVELQVYYDGQRQQVRIADDGTAEVNSPTTGQEVSLLIKNSGLDTYGVVVKVNGENTLRRQRLPSAGCSKWILGPGDAVKIRGYQMAKDRMEKFEVLPPKESAEDELHYGDHVGTFSLEAFPERKKSEARTVQTRGREDVTAIGDGLFPPMRPQKLETLKEKLRNLQAQLTSRAGDRGRNRRGLIKPGEVEDNVTVQVPFEAAADPVAVSVIRYYHVKK
jgi:hypothetical protein